MSVRVFKPSSCSCIDFLNLNCILLQCTYLSTHLHIIYVQGWAKIVYSCEYLKQFILVSLFIYSSSPEDMLIYFRERKGGRKRGRETLMWETSVGCLSHAPQLETEPATWAFGLIMNWTLALLVCRMMILNQLSHSSQCLYYHLFLIIVFIIIINLLLLPLYLY